MSRLTRLSCYMVVILFFLFLSITTLSTYQTVQPTTKRTTGSPRHGTKYLSWLPHGEFTDQHEAFRNAIRLGKELDRTVIAPMLRLGKPLPWQPFDTLAHSYTFSQNKQQLNETCHTNDQACNTMNDWTEIPWSSLFDLKAISSEFGIPIIERTQGHGWGIDESALVDTITDVVVVDVLTFIENATLHNGQGRRGKSSVKQDSLPLKTVIRPQQWDTLTHRQYIQFGSLSSTARYQVHTTSQQMALRKALNRHLLVSPNQMVPLKQQADKVIETLGGVNHFSSLRLDLAKVIALDARVNKDGALTMDDLDTQTQKELMDAVVLEVFGDIPINQAVSAALPVKPDSDLANVLSQPTSLERKKLLEACINYRQHYEERYPIYYLVNDHIPSPASRPDIYGPLLSFFPCLFTKHDMKQWGKLDMSTWISSHPVLQEKGVDYEKMLDFILDILIAGQGYSFFEVPNSPLTRFMGWQRRVVPAKTNTTIESSSSSSHHL
ncbi:hypothetical protein BC941DRAFT_438708 [Chlamydoabsidia padenii]|nr:hypothetical protein BC941DRAFT_438708 [Chlamydoabsidia padenii]